MDHDRKNQQKIDVTRSESLDEALARLDEQTPEDVRELTPQFRTMSDEERSLEARLDRALTPEMRQRVKEALEALDRA